jgi:hypothetical protein
MSAKGPKQTYAVHQPVFALLPITTAKAHLRKTPCPLYRESGHVRCTSSCLLWAKSGHRATYSVRYFFSVAEELVSFFFFFLLRRSVRRS